MKKVTIYTDGSCLRNPGGRGGYAAILKYGGRNREVKGGEPTTTNNRMELMAVIAGLEAISFPVMSVNVYTDSKYVRNAFTKGWLSKWQSNGWRTIGGQPVKNKDLWLKLLKLYGKYLFNIHWVPGHQGNPHNERVDYLARREALKQ